MFEKPPQVPFEQPQKDSDESREFKREKTAEQPPEITVEEKEREREYNPLEPLRRDFNSESVKRNEKGDAVIDDPDLHNLMRFYRDSIKEGSLLDIGAGATHHHYMIALEDKLSAITALDLSPRNIQLLRELQEGAVNKQSEAPKYIESKDIEVLKITAEAVAADPRYGKERSTQEMLNNIAKKTSLKDGSPDLVVGDMYDLSPLGDRKFDNVLLGFSLFVSKDEKDLARLFSEIKKHLEPGGRIIISDFGDPEQEEILFQDEDLETFYEDKPILDKYHADFRLDKKTLSKTLKDVGFVNVKIAEKSVEAEGSEAEHELKYMFATAENKILKKENQKTRSKSSLKKEIK